MENFPFPFIFLLNVINRHKTVRNPCWYILTGHVEYESCREPNFSLLAVLISVYFRVRIDRRIFFLCRRCSSVVVNRLSTVFTVSRTVIATIFTSNVTDDKLIHTGSIRNRIWPSWDINGLRQNDRTDFHNFLLRRCCQTFMIVWTLQNTVVYRQKTGILKNYRYKSLDQDIVQL